MTTEREVELKFFLPDERAAEALEAEAAGRRVSCVMQVNHLFDTPDRRLRGNGLTLRLREEEGAWTVTLKGPARRLGAARDRTELEASVTPQRAARILAGEATPLDDLDSGHALAREAGERAGGRVARLGSFRNRRITVAADLAGYGPALLEIDRTELPGGRIDHEVELEVPADAGEVGAASAEAALRDLLEATGVSAVQASGKSGRFLTALDERGG
jgi:uncharacterized protein YjbK